MKKSVATFSIILFSILTLFQTVTAATPSVEKWGVFTIELNGPSNGNPYTDVTFSAVFKNASQTIQVSGFYNGEGQYVIRFSPNSKGNWSYLTTSNAQELTGKTGTFTCVKPSNNNHGPVQVTDTYYFKYADGKPYFSVGTTCYAWISQSKDLQDLTMKTLANAPFNKLRMCLFPKSYIYNSNEPERFAFLHRTDSTFDFTKFDPIFWTNLENRIAELGKLGIQADLILFHPYDRWGFATMDKASDDRYLRYAIARLGAYQNVWWSLANEFDFMTIPIRAGHNGNKDWTDWDRFFSILQNEDPYQRLRGIHNGKIWYDHTKVWVSHASVQNSNLDKGIELRNKYKKPVVFDECRYEGNIERGWGQLSGKTMTERFWLGAVNGCYVGHGETFLDPNDILWWAKGGTLHGESPARIAFFRKIMETLPFNEMQPARQDSNVFVLSKSGQVYLVYALKAGPIRFKLDGKTNYTVTAIDTWNMKLTKLAAAKPGAFSFEATEPNCALLLTKK
jgi:hypothetical protein